MTTTVLCNLERLAPLNPSSGLTTPSYDSGAAADLKKSLLDGIAVVPFLETSKGESQKIKKAKGLFLKSLTLLGSRGGLAECSLRSSPGLLFCRKHPQSSCCCPSGRWSGMPQTSRRRAGTPQRTAPATQHTLGDGGTGMTNDRGPV